LQNSVPWISAGDIVTSYEAQKANESLIAGGEKIRELAHEDVISKKNLSNIMAGLFYNDNAVAAFRSKTIGPIERSFLLCLEKLKML